MKQFILAGMATVSLSALAHAQDLPLPQAPEHTDVIAMLAPSAPSAPETDPTVDALAGAMLQSISLGNDKQGNAIPAAHCRLASEGCKRRLQELAQYMTDVGRERGVDPWLLAAIAVRESGLDPFARGTVGELGILQIHPKRPDAKQVRFMRDALYRRQCRNVPGACQREIVVHAAHILQQNLGACHGRLGAALGAYNTGRCGGSSVYTQRVLSLRAALRASAKLLASKQRTALASATTAPKAPASAVNARSPRAALRALPPSRRAVRTTPSA